MNSFLISDVLFLLLNIVCLVITLRAFNLYRMTYNDTLFTLGLSMGTVTLSILFGVLTRTHLFGSFNGDWVNYLGNDVAFGFLLLNSLARNSAQVAQVKRWHVIFTALFVALILITPLLPPFSSSVEPVSLNIIRAVVCYIVFLRFTAIYLAKETRFSLMLCLAFLLLGVGFTVITPQLIDARLTLFFDIGVIIRIIGYSLLFAAFSVKE